jgi:DNA-binding NarL/FixJ family response regulator
MSDTPRSVRVRVMLVDDHALVRAAIRQALAAPDLEVVAEAATAEETLEVAPRLRPDVLLLDIDLPGMDGIRMLRELAPRLPETRFVMLSASSAERGVIEALRNGASGYLTKDLAPAALLRAVRGAHRGELAMGRAMALRVIRRLAETGPRRATDPGDPELGSLSAREIDVLRLLAEGLTDREIAGVLTVSPRTVETHVSSILHKMQARNRADAARRYRDRA